MSWGNKMNGGVRNELGMKDRPRAEPENKLGDKMFDKLTRRVQGSWARRPGHRQGEEAFPLHYPMLHIHLPCQGFT